MHQTTLATPRRPAVTFIGDLSLRDADLLDRLAGEVESILEFGVGGSTQIFARRCGCVVTIDTDPAWIERTKSNLVQLSIPGDHVRWLAYDGWTAALGGQQFDLVFVDGRDDLRRDFALAAWEHVRLGGKMVFHDTRRPTDLQNVAAILVARGTQIGEIACNAEHSNLTVISRRPDEPYVNWTEAENKALWQYGYDHAKGGTMPTIAQREPTKRLARKAALRLNLGCGAFPQPGLTNIDCRPLPGVDQVLDVTQGLPFPDASAELIVAHHFIEHLRYPAADALLRECCRILVPEGRLQLITPDFGVFVRCWGSPEFDRRAYATYLLYPDEHGQTHCSIWDRDMLVVACAAAGFTKAILLTPSAHLVADVPWQTGITAIK